MCSTFIFDQPTLSEKFLSSILKTAQSSNYKTHMRWHTDERPYKCDMCEKSYVQKINLIWHKQRHTGEKSFECVPCERKFGRKSRYIAHMKIHSSGKVHKCSQCTKEFTHTKFLTSHERMVHSTELQQKCSECDKRFKTEHQLVVHMRSHTIQLQYLSNRICFDWTTKKTYANSAQ